MCVCAYVCVCWEKAKWKKREMLMVVSLNYRIRLGFLVFVYLHFLYQIC